MRSSSAMHHETRRAPVRDGQLPHGDPQRPCPQSWSRSSQPEPHPVARRDASPPGHTVGQQEFTLPRNPAPRIGNPEPEAVQSIPRRLCLASLTSTASHRPEDAVPVPYSRRRHPETAVSRIRISRAMLRRPTPGQINSPQPGNSKQPQWQSSWYRPRRATP